MEPLSLNFSAKELRCRCPVCKSSVPNKIDPYALAALQRVREAVGAPLSLTSAYRCAEHPEERKKKVPGRHHSGLAFDIAVPWGQLRGRIIECALIEGFHGFGFANTFLHLDYRSGPTTTWGYK